LKAMRQYFKPSQKNQHTSNTVFEGML